jgi:DNA-binding beta-propeller fold protein YncE
LPDKIEHPSLGSPADAAVAQDGSVYVLTGYGIKKLDRNGHLLLEWGSKGSGDGEFSYPRGITIDKNGNLYVADTNNHRIQKFSSDCTFVAKWGSQGSADGQFSSPRGITIDKNGNLYVADSDNHRIQTTKPTKKVVMTPIYYLLGL